MNDTQVSVVMPVQNQADHIERILTSYMATMSELGETFELIPVINASTDESETIINRMAERDARVRPQVTPERGWGRAVRLGLEAAHGEVLCYTNAARTQADDLVTVLRHYFEHRDCLVKATRVARESLMRRLGSQSYNVECRLLFGLDVRDINGTPKAFARSVWERAPLTDNGDIIDLEFLVNCKRLGVPVIEVPITSTRRHGGVSSTKLKTAFGLWLGAVRMWAEQIRQTGA